MRRSHQRFTLIINLFSPLEEQGLSRPLISLINLNLFSHWIELLDFINLLGLLAQLIELVVHLQLLASRNHDDWGHSFIWTLRVIDHCYHKASPHLQSLSQALQLAYHHYFHPKIKIYHWCKCLQYLRGEFSFLHYFSMLVFLFLLQPLEIYPTDSDSKWTLILFLHEWQPFEMKEAANWTTQIINLICELIHLRFLQELVHFYWYLAFLLSLSLFDLHFI